MLNRIKRSGRLAGIYTTYAGILFGFTWLLDRWLVWQLVRTTPAMAAAAPCSEVAHEGKPVPRCASLDCPNAPTVDIHGWLVCDDHRPPRGATITDARAVKGS